MAKLSLDVAFIDLGFADRPCAQGMARVKLHASDVQSVPTGRRRCLVPLDRFAEPHPGKGAGNAWFAVTQGRPTFFAGIWVLEWISMRKLKDGETTDDLFAFLTCDPNGVVAPIHPKAKELQRPLPDDLLKLSE